MRTKAMVALIPEVSNVANKYTARKMFDFDRSLEIDPEYAAAYHSREPVLSEPKLSDASCADFEIVNHLMAMRLTDFDEKVPSDLAI
jgi:hypothetical protein